MSREEGDGTAQIDVNQWLSRATMDVIGEGARARYLYYFLYCGDSHGNEQRPSTISSSCFTTIQRRWSRATSICCTSQTAFSWLYSYQFFYRCDALGSPSKLGIFVQSISQYLPTRLLNFLSDNVPAQRLERLRQNARDVNKVSQGLIEEKYEALKAGKGRRDVMSLLGEITMYSPKGARIHRISRRQCVRTRVIRLQRG